MAHHRYHLRQGDKVYHLNFAGYYGIQQQTNVLPIIQTFPVDLLAEIFLLSRSARLPPVIHLSREPPMSLSRVCRSWREVALGLSRLWTAICVDMNALPEGSGENNSLRVSVHQWVARAKPFSLTFNFSFKRGSRGGPKLITAFNTFVASFAPRLRYLNLHQWICSPEIIVRFAISSTGDCNFTGYSTPSFSSNPARPGTFASWGHLAYGRAFLSLPHSKLLRSPSTTQNDRSTPFFKCP